MSSFILGEASVGPGQRATVNLPVSTLSNHTHVMLPVHVVHGEEPGPAMFLSGAIHGDEIQGVEIIRRILNHPALQGLRGTLLAVPIVNSFGFLNHTRYMPDRRDLNRCFPGTDRGSLASLVADIFFREVVLKSQYGVDFHTAALHRSNLPQVRLAPDEPELLRLAQAFAPPVILISRLREGSLRLSARGAGVKVLLYEGGEALRFDEPAIDAAVRGTLRVMAHLGMVEPHPRPVGQTVLSDASSWVRAPESGILHTTRRTGDRVGKGEVVGVVADPWGQSSLPLFAEWDGIIVGRTNLPLVNRGDAVFHIARATPLAAIRQHPDEAAALADEDEII
ncbi:succinylglutamate desuccinylase/aspartoacylase family protein [Aestuariivirga sp.]|uniref:succinylglutamate desuccinylase/aspartoacylase family protein n=1 Tax=Aestuariivirga sp. TaxID=2650926 RepID=UPI0025B7F564|nr:succinylglutamate desuccinylase/aspartoacylase family protein [Aestuariivirga sp.]MCA3556283.1 succinylglutamate desuccinylase/aspartoacylase family protein [Aestuariivirga sp.]